MPETLLTTREVAAYLHINEKQVYRLIQNGDIPCTRVTGKWLFPQSLIEDWVKRSAQPQTPAGPPDTTPFDIERGLLLAGSNDLLLDVLMELTSHCFPEQLFYTTNLGSFGGLKALKQAKAHVALAHLRDQLTGEYNVPFLSQSGQLDPVAVTLWHRQIGLISRPGKQKIRSFADLPGKKTRFMNRQAGSGVRWLVDQQLQQLNVKPQSVTGYETEARTHWEVGLSVLHNRADVGVAVESVAHQLGLGFHEIVEERFDLLVSKDVYFTKSVQALLEVVSSSALKAQAAILGGYDLRDAGKVALAAS
jgi:putative molybdopterin biosynthesis protein